ncbi:MAG: type II toxin-antitoxin system VapC family toxin [Chloroflexi bacterium]|nr:type II toxin-antitoxin system VapC family toxin [Chloroflexota bacterium]
MLLLDTDILVDVLRRHPPAIAWLDSRAEPVAVPGYVAMELFQGCRNRNEQQRVRRVLNDFTIAWLAPDACDQALSVFADAALSHNLGILDALIGQLAISLNLPLHTFNEKHYAVIPNLKTAQPYAREP